MSDKNIKSLLDQLNNNLRALQGSYSAFETKCKSPEKVQTPRPENPNYKIEEKFVIISQELKDMSSSFKVIKEFISQVHSKLNKTQEEAKWFSKFTIDFEETLQSVTEFECSFQCLFTNFNSLSDLIKYGIKGDQRNTYQNKMLTPSSKIKRSDLLGDKPNYFFSNQKLRKFDEDEECQIILDKMSLMTDKINTKTGYFGKSDGVEYDFSDSNQNKVLKSLEEENSKLKKTLRDFEEKEISYLETKSQLDAASIENSNLHLRLEESERTLIEKEFKAKQLLKIIEESNFERKRTFESFMMLKDQMEEKAYELEVRIKALQDENSEKETTSKEKSAKISALEREKKEILKENVKLVNNFEKILADFKEKEAKIKGFASLSEKNERLVTALKEKELETEKIIQKFLDSESQLKEKEIECEILSKSLQKSEERFSDSKLKLSSLFREYEEINNQSKSNEEKMKQQEGSIVLGIQKKLEVSENKNSDYLDQIDSLKLSLEVYKKKLEESQKQLNEYINQVYTLNLSLDNNSKELAETSRKNSEYINQIENLQVSLSVYEKQIEENDVKLTERDSIIVSLRSDSLKSADIKSLRQSKESLEYDNESLIESQAFITDYVKHMKSSYDALISDLNSKLEASEAKIKDLTEELACQQYICNKLEKQRKFSQSTPRSRVSFELSAPLDPELIRGELKKICENKEIDLNIVALIGIELDEPDPTRFVDKIIDIKQERDFYYVTSQKFEDTINELKEELGEDDDYNLLSRVVALKKTKINS